MPGMVSVTWHGRRGTRTNVGGAPQWPAGHCIFKLGSSHSMEDQGSVRLHSLSYASPARYLASNWSSLISSSVDTLP